jgi:hypothetical protein
MSTSFCAYNEAVADEADRISSSAVTLPKRPAGIHIEGTTPLKTDRAQQAFLAQLEALGLQDYVDTEEHSDAHGLRHIEFRLRSHLMARLTPDFDTMQLCSQLGLDTESSLDDLEREILLAMLVAPIPFQFPSYAELASSVRIRKNIVVAARKTTLDFHTTAVERPEDYWRYVDGRGFTLLPGKSLIDALKKATQPEESGSLYAFSCYRATEYVILLGIAQELASCNPKLLDELQRIWESRAIQSGEFHDVFLYEYGSLSEPLPLQYFVPGDRTWFRNPDNHSSDVGGYEGSWVMYLGGGLFTNFWKRNKPYTMTAKCVEVFHWRHAVYQDQSGELQIDEAVVERLVEASLRDPKETDRILAEMFRLREPPGVYVDGGCIDASREFPRRVCPLTCELALPTD